MMRRFSEKYEMMLHVQVPVKKYPSKSLQLLDIKMVLAGDRPMCRSAKESLAS